MSRVELYRELKTINPGTSQKWPRVSVESLKNEINSIRAQNTVTIPRNVLYKQYKAIAETVAPYNVYTAKNLKKKINAIMQNAISKEIKRRELVKTRFERRLKQKARKESSPFREFLTNPEHEKRYIPTKSELLSNLRYFKHFPEFLLKIKYNKTITNEANLIATSTEEYKFIKNLDELKKLIDLITSGGYIEHEAQQIGSDIDVVERYIRFGGIIEFEWQEKKLFKKSYNGAYFQYYHKLQIDLTRYQIYTRKQKIDYEPCLLYSFKVAGVEEAVIEQLQFLIQQKDVFLRELNKVAKAIGYRINVTYNDSRNKAVIRVYNKDCKQEINLGLVDSHYFINEETNYTSEVITGKHDTRKRKLMSYDLIRKLYVNRERLLEEITIENINNHNHDLAFGKNYKLRDLKKTEFKEYNTQSKKSIFKGKFKPENDPNDNYRLCFVDLETFANENGVHKPYCLGYSYSDEDKIKHFYGLDCVENFLKSLKTNCVIITHNLAFDFRGFINHIEKLQTPIETGTKLKHIQCKFGNHHLVFKDNYSFLPFKLSALPSMFNLKSGDKGVYPYTLINSSNISSMIHLNEALDHLKPSDHLDFISNCNKSSCIFNDIVDIEKYTVYYCDQDVNILKNAYLAFRAQIKEITKLDIITLISLPQLSDEYFKSQGVYDDCYKISGHCQDFIRRACHGGRVMTSNNKRYHIQGTKLADFDAVSLYPSAMHRLPGYLKGIPKLIKPNDDWLNADYYYVEIEIMSLGKKRDFPLASIKRHDGIKDYTNEIVGQRIVIDKVSLEDLVKFQDVTYKFIRGYMFNNGFNPRITEVIEFMFNERIRLKKQCNPLQNAYKLILNASYGKLIQKPINSSKVFYYGDHMNYAVRNANSIIEFYKVNDNLTCFKKKKSIIDHFTGVHMASQVLSMSKRIMNQVICLAEDNGLKIYYQDTDSMHIEASEIITLADKYRAEYGRELIGKKMGMFHSDFDVANADSDYEINAVESIFLGKKSYIDKLEYKQNGEIKYDYHIRMKGIPSSIIKSYNPDVMQTYEKLYNGECIELDLTAACPLEMTKTYQAVNREAFKRKMHFPL